MSTEQQIVEMVLDGIGGAGNITSFSYCAARLRFEPVDASKADADALDRTDGVLDVVPQGDDRYQVVISGAIAGVCTAMQSLPGMLTGVTVADTEIKAQTHSEVCDKLAWLNTFFEYPSDSSHPTFGALLEASLIIAFVVMLDALGIVDFRATGKSTSWAFVNVLWRAVFYFLPIMVAYNAAKKLDVNPWFGGAIMAILVAPELTSLSNKERLPEFACTASEFPNTKSRMAYIFGLPLRPSDYGSSIFVPLITVAILALAYKGLKMTVPTNLQMVPVPSIAIGIMILATTFLTDPLGVWLGSGLGVGIAWMNSRASFVFTLTVPMVYPFLVSLGLHWLLNALMLVNIQIPGYDFIQGLVGAWNFACFGVTAGVLSLSMCDKDIQMRQAATDTLAAGLLGDISEPSLYGTHLRSRRIYPLVLVGCSAGGLTITILDLTSGDMTTSTFVPTSLLTIPVSDSMWIYVTAVIVAFFTAFILVALFDYRTAEQETEALTSAGGTSAAATAAIPVEEDEVPVADTEPTTAVFAPVGGQVLPLVDSGDKVFALGALGEGAAIVPNSDHIVFPVMDALCMATKTGHAFDIKTDDDVEVLVYVGIDTASVDGEGSEVLVERKQRVEVGDALVDVDLAKVTSAGYATTTLMIMTNSRATGAVTPIVGTVVNADNPVIDIAR